MHTSHEQEKFVPDMHLYRSGQEVLLKQEKKTRDTAVFMLNF